MLGIPFSCSVWSSSHFQYILNMKVCLLFVKKRMGMDEVRGWKAKDVEHEEAHNMRNVTLFMNYYYNALNELFSEDAICCNAVNLMNAFVFHFVIPLTKMKIIFVSCRSFNVFKKLVILKTLVSLSYWIL